MPVNLYTSLASDSKFIFPVHSEAKEWGTLSSPGVDAQPTSARAPASGRRRPSSGSRVRQAPRPSAEVLANVEESRLVEEPSRLIYPPSDAGGEWNSFAGLDGQSNERAAPVDRSAVDRSIQRASGGVVNEQVVGRGSTEGGEQALGGSMGGDSVDLLLARNEERLRRLEAIST